MTAVAATTPLCSALDLRAAVRSLGPATRLPPTIRLDRLLRCEPARGQIEVQCRAGWDAVGAELASAAGVDEGALRAAFACLPPTVGACLDANPALPDGSPFVSAVESVAVVTADGELKCASRDRHDELFRALVGGRGCLGAVYSVTLAIAALRAAARDATPPVCLEIPAGDDEGPDDRLVLFVPPHALDELVATLRQRTADNRIALRSLSARRARPDRETLLAWATEDLAVLEARFARPPTLPARVAAAQVRKDLIDAALEHGGRFDLDTGFDASRRQVLAGYPGISAFVAEAKRFDPGGRFAGPWLRHYAALLACGPVAGRWSDL